MISGSSHGLLAHPLGRGREGGPDGRDVASGAPRSWRSQARWQCSSSRTSTTLYQQQNQAQPSAVRPNEIKTRFREKAVCTLFVTRWTEELALGALAGERIVQLHEPDLLTLIEEGEGVCRLRSWWRRPPTPSGPNGAVRKEAVVETPLVNPPKLICIGLNYREHAGDEQPIQKAPIVFRSRFGDCRTGRSDHHPPVTNKVDYEVERPS